MIDQKQMRKEHMERLMNVEKKRGENVAASNVVGTVWKIVVQEIL